MYYVCYVLLYCIIFAFGAAIGSFPERLYLPSAQRGISLAEQLPLHDLRYTHSQAGSDPDLQLVPSAGKMPQLRGKNPLSLHAGGKPECDLIRVDLCLFRHL